MNPDRTAHSGWMDAFFASYYTHRPVNATFIGVHDFDDRLPDFSEEGAGDALADAQDLLRRSERVSGMLTGPQAIDLRLARGFLEIQQWELRSEHFHRGNPSLYTGEAVFGVMGLFLTDFAPLAGRVEAASARMRAIADFLAQARANARRAPPTWTERAIRECDGAFLLFTDGVAELAATHWIDDASFAAAAEDAAKAFAEHRVWLESELLARPSDAYACGAEAFDGYLGDGHSVGQSAEEIVRYAEDQMAEAEAYLAQHAADFGASTTTEALAGLSEMHPTADGYYASYQEVWDQVRRISDERRLLTWPDFPIRYVPRPGWTRAAAPHLYFLSYRSPAASDRPEVHDYLVAPLPADGATSFLRANNRHVIKLNHVIHHGGLGHHVQNWHAYRAESRVGRVAAVDCASRIAMFCGGNDGGRLGVLRDGPRGGGRRADAARAVCPVPRAGSHGRADGRRCPSAPG